MHTTETLPRQQHPFATNFSTLAFGGRLIRKSPKNSSTGAALVEAADQHARESAHLLRQISTKAPQLASVLDQLNEGSTPERIELTEPALQDAPQGRFNGGAMLDAAAGFLSHAFPANAPLFHGCRAFLQMKMIKNKKQA